MLKKKHRLAKTSAVKTALKIGRSFFNPDLSLKYLPGQTLRFTVVVSAKVDKRAVKRNRLKRIIREFIRYRLLNFKLGDYVVILKSSAAKKTEHELIKNLEYYLTEKWKLLKKL